MNITLSQLTGLKCDKIISNELAISLIMLTTVNSLNCCLIFGVKVEVYYSSIKHHKLKRRVELKERKILAE